MTAGDGDGCDCGFYAENINPISLDTFEETTRLSRISRS